MSVDNREQPGCTIDAAVDHPSYRQVGGSSSKPLSNLRSTTRRRLPALLVATENGERIRGVQARSADHRHKPPSWCKLAISSSRKSLSRKFNLSFDGDKSTVAHRAD